MVKLTVCVKSLFFQGFFPFKLVMKITTTLLRCQRLRSSHSEILTKTYYANIAMALL